MTDAQALDLLRQLKAGDFKSIVFGGGEPFQWPGKLLALTEEAKKMGFLVQVGTNAVALPENYQYIQSIDRYVLPLESSLSAVHNRMRFYKNRHQELIIDRLSRLRDAKKSVTLSTIITRVNRDDLRPLALFLKEFNALSPFIHAWHLYKFIPQGRGGRKNASDLMIPDEAYASVCDGLKSMDLPFKVYQRKDMYHSRTVDFFWYKDGLLRSSGANRALE